MKIQIRKLTKSEALAYHICSWDDCFENSEWAIEGCFYCDRHKKEIEKLMEKH